MKSERKSTKKGQKEGQKEAKKGRKRPFFGAGDTIGAEATVFGRNSRSNKRKLLGRREQSPGEKGSSLKKAYLAYEMNATQLDTTSFNLLQHQAQGLLPAFP